MSAWIEGRVAGRRAWSASLFSLLVDAPQIAFTAGQFARLSLPAPPGSKEPMVGRPYSFVNPPVRQPHEFYFIILPEGPLSPRLARLDEGESVWLAPRANGFFTIAETAAAQSLWCLSTGTGIVPGQDFSLTHGDVVAITIGGADGITTMTLENEVAGKTTADQLKK